MFDKPLPDNLKALFEEEERLRKTEVMLQNRKRELAEAKRVMENLTATHKLAIVLHEKLCRWNHTDGCAWHYAVKAGVHDWSEHSHDQYLRKAALLMHKLETEPVTQGNVIDFIQAL